ncbi:FAD-binding protein [Sphingomonas sp.]|uniref:FAD-binding protein n=1 Tax=Sphingomonas sp. TaxID=28214 RepID=UPI001B0DFADC|nr:FAD-binding protein [Sphingomonas sp.]MBO9712732.1 FAD-binding protein [Sphingomonas sp.]
MSEVWNNYHGTHMIEVFDQRRFNPKGKLQPDGKTKGQEMFALSSADLFAHLRLADASGTYCGLIGKAWSFSMLTGNTKLQLECGGKLAGESHLEDNSGLVGIVPFRPGELHAASQLRPGLLAWVRGGTTMRALALWAEAHNLSISTSGDQLGPSLAGAIATGTHGSRLGYGALQNMVRGLHLITGDGHSVWIERASNPVLADTVATSFADKVIRDDRKFADALVHLGAMGIVNGAIVELEPLRLFQKNVPILRLAPMWDDWLKAVRARDFARAAKILGCDISPIFYEFSLNPFDPKGEESVHIFYSPTTALIDTEVPGRTPRPADAVIQYVLQQTQLGMLEPDAAPAADLPAIYIGLVRKALEDEASLPNARKWSVLHSSDQATGGPGMLYNAGFAIPFGELSRAIDIMCDTVKDMGPGRQFIFTYRFVTGAAGTLAHLRWPESVAVELDGASPAALLPYQIGAPNSLQAAKAIQDAFHRRGLPFAMHWGKLGNAPAIVKENFGSAAEAASSLGQWNKTRDALLQPEGKRTMRNQLVDNYDLA